MKSHEQAYGEPFAVMLYHVTDTHGRHRFLTMNSFAIEHLGGIDAFEGILARQFQTSELLGTTAVAVAKEDPAKFAVDTVTAYRIRTRIEQIVAACPSSSHCLEPWLPSMGECTLH